MCYKGMICANELGSCTGEVLSHAHCTRANATLASPATRCKVIWEELSSSLPPSVKQQVLNKRWCYIMLYAVVEYDGAPSPMPYLCFTEGRMEECKHFATDLTPYDP